MKTGARRSIDAPGFWQYVSSHDDSYSAIILQRRGDAMNRAYLGIDGSSGSILMTDRDDPLLALGIAGSGKTASVITLNALLAPGPMFSATSRSDVYMATSLARARIGKVWHFTARDRAMPGAAQLRWSPLQGCESFEFAQETTKRFADYKDMGTSARASAGAGGNEAHFRERAGALLAVLFHFAARHDRDMEWVVGKVASLNPKGLIEPLAKLKFEAKRPLLVDIVEGFIDTAPNEMSGVMSTAARAMNCYTTEAALRTTREPNFDFGAFVRGRPQDSSRLFTHQDQWTPFDHQYEAFGLGRHLMGVYDSVYLTDSDSESPVLPIYLEFIHRIRKAAADYSEECGLNGYSAPTPTSLILDELRASPVPEIERILADCRERGLIVVGGIQSLNQAKDLYKQAGNDFLSAWRNTLAFRGIQDKDTLQLLSLLCGKYWKEVQGWNESRNVKTQRWEYTGNISRHEVPRLSEDDIRQGHPNMPDAALLVRRDMPFLWVREIPYFLDPWSRLLINSAEHARSDGLDHPLPPLAKNGDYKYLEARGLADRFRTLQKTKMGGLPCPRTSTRGDPVPTPMPTRRRALGTARMTDRHARIRTTSMPPGGVGPARVSSTTSRHGSYLPGCRSAMVSRSELSASSSGSSSTHCSSRARADRASARWSLASSSSM